MTNVEHTVEQKMNASHILEKATYQKLVDTVTGQQNLIYFNINAHHIEMLDTLIQLPD